MNTRSIEMVFVRAGLIGLAAFFCAARHASAVSVVDAHEVFGDVSIVGMDDGKLTFRFKDGRTLSRSVLDIKEISIAGGSEPGGDEVTRADALCKEKQFEQAASLYE